MSESIERRVVRRRTEQLQEKVRSEHRRWDTLTDREEIEECTEGINKMYDEMLILHRIILDADYEASRIEVNT